MTVAVTYSPVEPKADESTVTLAYTGLTASTAYLVAIGATGTISAPTTADWNAIIPNDTKVIAATSDGSGNLNVTFVPPNAGTWTTNVYTAPTFTTLLASSFVAISAA